MSDAHDIAVLGAGPAGGHAALTAARAGLRVVLIDEQSAPGGQVWRGKSAGVRTAPATPESRAGGALRTALAHSDVRLRADTRIWDIRRDADGWTLQADRGDPVTARALILAPGAREFVQPVPGWTTPGVIGLAGATALFKQALTLPGKHTVVSGTGPLVFYVAHEIRRLGGKVAAIVTPNTGADWLRALPAMLGQPRLALRGALWVADLVAARVPILWGHAVQEICGGDHVSEILTRDLRRGRDGPGFAADSLCLGHGLIPNFEAAQMLGVPIRHDPALGGWVPESQPDGSTELPGLYLCGDGCGIRGALAAAIQGRRAGARAASDLGRNVTAPGLRDWQRAARFGQAMTALSRPSPTLQALTTDATVVCRCESLTRADILSEIESGAASSNAVKSGLRAGMGPCGGKYCQSAIAALIAAETGRSTADVPPPTARSPLRPVPLAEAAGAFDYDDLPIPKPAPL